MRVVARRMLILPGSSAFASIRLPCFLNFGTLIELLLLSGVEIRKCLSSSSTLSTFSSEHFTRTKKTRVFGANPLAMSELFFELPNSKNPHFSYLKL